MAYVWENGGFCVCIDCLDIDLKKYGLLCNGAFLYVRYIYLLISNKFCDQSLLLRKGGGTLR
jgi:hypothetical protein